METISAQSYVDNIIEQYVPNEFTGLWGQLRDEMKLAYSLSGKQGKKQLNNSFGNLIRQVEAGEKTPSELLELVAKTSGGPAKMNELMRAVGTENQIKFERGLVKELYTSKTISDKNLGLAIQRIKKLGLITPEGRHMKSMLSNLDNAFNTDDFADLVSQMLTDRNAAASRGGTNALTASIIKKIEYSTMANIWDNYVKKNVFAWTDQSKWLRKMDRIVKAVKEGHNTISTVPELTDDMYKSFRATIRESVEEGLTREVDELERVMAESTSNPTAAEVLDVTE
jgi:hypothetical protein